MEAKQLQQFVALAETLHFGLDVSVRPWHHRGHTACAIATDSPQPQQSWYVLGP